MPSKISQKIYVVIAIILFLSVAWKIILKKSLKFNDIFVLKE